MDFGAALGKMGGAVGGAMEKNAEDLRSGTSSGGGPSPTSAFIAAARQAALERQQAGAMQQQTTPTALAGGATTQVQQNTPMAGGAVATPTMQSQGALALPPSGLVTQGTPDPALLAAMAQSRR
jgi:hypothetical protein